MTRTGIERRIDRLHDQLPERLINGVYGREPRDFAEFSEWASAGYGFEMRPGGAWERLYESAISDTRDEDPMNGGIPHEGT